MPTYNYKARELIAKVVYYGPGRCGKTTNLQQIHARMRPETRSELLSVATETDRTIYFDLLPLNLGTISGMKFMVRLFTVPGQVYYSETRKLVLRGADGIVFVADSQEHMIDENRESLVDLKKNLAANGLDYATLPLVLQYNKRDLPRLIPTAELDATLNDRHLKGIEATATQGKGVLETLRYVTVSVFNHIKSGGKISTPVSKAATPVAKPQAIATPSITTSAAPSAPPSVGVSHSPPAPRRDPSAAQGAIAKSKHDALQATRKASQSAPSAPQPSNGGFGNLEHATSSPHIVGPEFIIEEFKSFAVITSQLTERLTAVEREVKRLGRENQELREVLARPPHP